MSVAPGIERREAAHAVAFTELMDEPLFKTAHEFYAAASAEGVTPADDPLTNSCAMFAEIAGAVVGVVTFYELAEGQSSYWTPGAWIRFVYVQPEHRRKGIADAMLGAVVQLARTWAVGYKLALGTGLHNHKMQSLAERHGFATEHVVMMRR